MRTLEESVFRQYSSPWHIIGALHTCLSSKGPAILLENGFRAEDLLIVGHFSYGV